MATKELNTRIQLKYDTLVNWQKEDVTGKGANLVLLQGEIGIAYVPGVIHGTTETAPTVLFKVGNGTSTFKQLPWASAKAADVYDWAKASTRPTYKYGDADLTGFGSAATKSESYFDLSGAAAQALSDAKDYTDEQIAGISGTDTQYRIVVTDTTLKLQSKEKQEPDSSWADITGQSWNLNTVLAGSIASGNTGFVKGGDAYTELAKKQDNLQFTGTYDPISAKLVVTSDTLSATKSELEGKIAERVSDVVGGIDTGLYFSDDTSDPTVKVGHIALDSSSKGVNLSLVSDGLKATLDLDDGTGTVVTETTDGYKVDLNLASDEKVLGIDQMGFVATTLTIGYNSSTRKVQLKGINDAVVSEFDASAFIKDGMLWGEKAFVATAASQQISITKGSVTQSHTFTNLTVGNQYLAFCFTDGDTTPTYSWDIVDLQQLISAYAAGDGLQLDENEFSIKLATGNETFLSVDENGLKLDGVQSAINTAKAAAIADAATDAASKYQPLETGKGLSTNDFTNAYKTKLDGIATGATKVEKPSSGTGSTNGHILINGTDTTVYTEVANTVHDADYKHITVTTTSVSDGTTTLSALKNPNALTIGGKTYDGSAAVEVSALKNPFALTAGSKSYDGSAAVALSAIAATGNVNDLVQTSGDLVIFNCGSSTANI